jgi:hypothetical protein
MIMDIQKIVTALSEHSRELAEFDPRVQELHEQIRVQRSISDAHYENYCEALKRIDAVAKERNDACEEVKRLKQHAIDIDNHRNATINKLQCEVDMLKTEFKDSQHTAILWCEKASKAKAEMERMKTSCVIELEQMRKTAEIRPEPSRLEIAAMIMAGGVTGEYGMQALVYADMLIAAAKKPMKLS